MLEKNIDRIGRLADDLDSALYALKLPDPSGLMRFPVKDQVYTIREVMRFVSESGEAVYCSMKFNPVCDGGSSTGEEPGWDVRAFRSLVSRAEETTSRSSRRCSIDKI
jgi:hypothetical protein